MPGIAKLELWALRGCAILAALLLIAWRIYAAGERHIEEKYRARDAIASINLEATNAKNRAEESIRQAAVTLAETTAAEAQRDLAVYRRNHPLTGAGMARGLCPEADSDTAKACAGAGDAAAVAACKATRLFLEASKRDIAGRNLDALLAEADFINDSYGVCLATRPAASAKGPP